MEAPFYLGQEIVCIQEHPSGLLNLNEDYTVKNLYQCPKCKRWSVMVGIEIYADGLNCGCGYILLDTITDAPFPQFHFAPKQGREKSNFTFEEALNLVTKKEKVTV